MVNITRGFNLEFAFQSQKIPFDEWIEITTLCLAPLIAHIIAGVPEPTFLDQKQPKWHQRVTLYNPSTILWRYFSIFDRRIRAKSWNPFTMAASNAIFWTDQGWNGSEEMIKKSREHCLRKPASSHIDLISSSAAKTLIVTLQGVQALYTLIQGLSLEGNRKYGDTLGFHYLFVPLAIIGLIRLLSAYWLTEDYHFAHVESAETYRQAAQHTRRTEAQTGFTADHASTSLLPLSTAELENAFHPVLSWRGILSRVLFIILLLPLWLITGYYIAFKRSRYTVATFLINLFYFVALTGGILIHFIMFCSGRSRTTIIPCVSAPWYQVYTWFLYAFVVVMMVMAGLQTRRSPCGKYTTFGTHLDATLCPDLFNSTTGARLNGTMSAVDLRRYIN